MTYIDSAILNLTEWLCRRFQLLTGRTNVWLAVQLTNLSIIVYFVWAGVYFWSGDVAARIALGLFCSGVLYVLTQTVFKVPIEAYENEAYRRVAKGFRNPRRIRDALLRISFLTLSFVLFYPILFVYMQPSRPHGPPDLLPDRLDDDRAVPAGLRSAAPVRRETERVASRIGSVTTGSFRIARAVAATFPFCYPRGDRRRHRQRATRP